MQTKAGFPIIVTKNDESRNTEHVEVLRADSFDNSMSMRDHPLLNESMEKTEELEDSREDEEKASKPRPRRKADKSHAPELEKKKGENEEAGRRARRKPADTVQEAPSHESSE